MSLCLFVYAAQCCMFVSPVPLHYILFFFSSCFMGYWLWKAYQFPFEKLFLLYLIALASWLVLLVGMQRGGRRGGGGSQPGMLNKIYMESKTQMSTH